MGNTVKSGEHVEAVKTQHNVSHSKEGIEEIINGNIERDLVKNNHVNVNEKMKTGIRRERKGKESILKKYCQ